MGATFNDRGWAEREVKVRRTELLKILRENRAKHIEDYKLACEGYQEMAIQRIESEMDHVKSIVSCLKEGRLVKSVTVSFTIPAPDSHEPAYDQIIRMMEMCVDDVVELTSSQFACFVMDDWDWKHTWKVSNSMYIQKASNKKG